MTTTTRRTVVAALASLAALALAPTPARAEETFELKLATVAPDKTPWADVLKEYKKVIEEKSKGRIKVRVFLGGTMGDENETVRMAARGQLSGVGASTGAVASLVEELSAIEIPFLFANANEADYVLDKFLLAPMEEKFRAKDLVLGFWSENGFRHFGTKRKPVKVAADLKGQKMRSQESRVHEEMYKSLGASYQPIPTTEVPQALTTGTVDGFDQSLLYAVATAWHKNVDYVSLTGHIYQPGIIVMNKEWFEKLPADLQKVVVDEGRKLQQSGRDAVRGIKEDLVKIIEADKVKVYRPSDAELKALAVEAKKSYAPTKKHYGAEFSRILGLAEKKLTQLRK